MVKLDRRYVKKHVPKPEGSKKNESSKSRGSSCQLSGEFLVIIVAIVAIAAIADSGTDAQAIIMKDEKVLSKHPLRWDHNYLSVPTELLEEDWTLVIDYKGKYNNRLQHEINPGITGIVLKDACAEKTCTEKALTQ